MTTSIDHSLLVAQILNTIGPHLHDLQQAAGDGIHISLPDIDSPPETIDDCFVGTVNVSLSALFSLKKPLPDQIAECLLKMAGHLMDAGNRVVAIPAIVPPDGPVSYIVRDKLDGSEVAFPFHHEAVAHQNELRSRRHASEIVVRPVEDIGQLLDSLP